MSPKFPNIEVQLTGEDGNIFYIVSRVRRALREGGATDQQIERFSLEVQSSENYEAALRVVMEWVQIT